MSWRTKNPMDMANRMVACHMIKEIGAEKIRQGDQEIADTFLLPVANEEGKEYDDIDWEFVLFQATDFQLNKLFAQFERKPKSNLIVEEDKPKLII